MCNSSVFCFDYSNDTNNSLADLYFTYSISFSVLTGIPGNIFLLLCCSYFLYTYQHHLSPSIYHYFILSISTADLIFLIFLAIPQVIEKHFDMDLHSLHPMCCRIGMFLTHVSTVASSTGLLCLNIDKFIAITRPLHHVTLITPTRAILAILACWLIGICWATFFVLGPFTVSNFEICLLQIDPHIYFAFLTIFFIIPIVLAGIFCSAIAVVALKAIRRDRKQSLQMNIHHGQIGQHDGRNKVTKIALVFSTTIWSCFTCLPYRIWHIIGSHNLTDEKEEILSDIFGSLLIAHPAGNAFITLAVQHRYREIISDVVVYIVKLIGDKLGGFHRRNSNSVGNLTRTQTYATGISHVEGNGSPRQR